MPKHKSVAVLFACFWSVSDYWNGRAQRWAAATGWSKKWAQKMVLCILVGVLTSGCGLISAFRIRDEMQLETINTYEFKQNIPFYEEQGMMFVDVIVGGQPKRFIFDTGASTIIDDDFAKTIPYEIVGIRRHRDVTGTKRRIKTIKLHQFSVGSIPFGGVIAGISDLSELQAALCLDFVGILGANVMNKAIWQIDYTQKMLTITDSRDSLPLWDSDHAFNFYSAGQGTPTIHLVLGNEYRGDVIFDTGFTGVISLPQSMCPPEITQFITKHSVVKGLFSTTVNTSQTTFLPNLRLDGKFHLDKQMVSFSQNEFRPLIGNNFLKNFITIIDWKHQLISLKPILPTQDSIYLGFGFALQYHEGTIKIGSITEGSTAFLSGLRLGDPILQLDDTPLTSASFEDYCRLIQNWDNPTKDTLSVITAKSQDPIKVTPLNLRDFGFEY